MDFQIMLLVVFLSFTYNDAAIIRQKRHIEQRMQSRDLFEGDIKGVTAENIDELISRSNAIALMSNDGPARGAAINDPFAVWPEGKVYFEISDQFTSDEKRKINVALQEYHTKTCVKFIYRTNQQYYVSVRKARNSNDCSSFVGRLRLELQPQVLSLGSNCVHNGIIIHEFMHALGFLHEQSRWDRDKYISINRDNILPDVYENNFKKLEFEKSKQLNTAYDYNSIMHYEKFAFSRNNQPTIVPKRPNTNIGQRNGLSQTDIVEINRMYMCDNIPNPPSPPQPETVDRSQESIRWGVRLSNHYAAHRVEYAVDCKNKCIREIECKAMTYDSENGYCYLYKANYKRGVDTRYVWATWIK